MLDAYISNRASTIYCRPGNGVNDNVDGSNVTLDVFQLLMVPTFLVDVTVSSWVCTFDVRPVRYDNSVTVTLDTTRLPVASVCMTRLGVLDIAMCVNTTTT